MHVTELLMSELKPLLTGIKEEISLWGYDLQLSLSK